MYDKISFWPSQRQSLIIKTPYVRYTVYSLGLANQEVIIAEVYTHTYVYISTYTYAPVMISNCCLYFDIFYIISI